MSNFVYTSTIPAASNNPSDDQPRMLVNAASISSIVDVDHIGFNQTPGGKHRQVRLRNLSSLPAGAASEGMLYVKTSSSVSNLWYRPDNTSDEYQMTRTISASKTLFGTNISYGSPPAGFTQTGGWTFLPGGMMLQYGFYGKAGDLGNSGQVRFPVDWTIGAYSISLTLYRDSGGSIVTLSSTNPPTTTTFDFLSSTSGSDGIYWTAIGI